MKSKSIICKRWGLKLDPIPADGVQPGATSAARRLLWGSCQVCTFIVKAHLVSSAGIRVHAAKQHNTDKQHAKQNKENKKKFCSWLVATERAVFWLVSAQRPAPDTPGDAGELHMASHRRFARDAWMNITI